MITELDIKIIDSAPEKVYVYPELLTRAQILEKARTLHTMANKESDRQIYCLFDELFTVSPMQYEVCFPVSYLDLKKYDKKDFRILSREVIAHCEFKGQFEDLLKTVDLLKEYSEKNGYKLKKPYRFLFTLDKKSFMSNKLQKFKMEIQIPIEKV